VGRGAGTKGRGIQQQTLLALQAVAVIELRLLRTGFEGPVKIALAAPYEAAPAQVRIVKRVDALQKRIAPWQPIQGRVGVISLRLHPGLHLLVIQVFHVAVVVHHGGAEVGVGDRSDRRCWRRLQGEGSKRSQFGACRGQGEQGDAGVLGCVHSEPRYTPIIAARHDGGRHLADGIGIRYRFERRRPRYLLVCRLAAFGQPSSRTRCE